MRKRGPEWPRSHSQRMSELRFTPSCPASEHMAWCWAHDEFGTGVCCWHCHACMIVLPSTGLGVILDLEEKRVRAPCPPGLIQESRSSRVTEGQSTYPDAWSHWHASYTFLHCALEHLASCPWASVSPSSLPILGEQECQVGTEHSVKYWQAGSTPPGPGSRAPEACFNHQAPRLPW